MTSKPEQAQGQAAPAHPAPAPEPAPTAPVAQADLDIVEQQLGRTPRGTVAISARCVCGNPVVVRTAPRLPDGTPFPTSYYLTHPGATAAVSTLESTGVMREWSDELTRDSELAAAYRRAHESFLADRAELGDVPEVAGISAGGMPTRVKCLHVLVAHSLAKGPGINPLGDRAVEMLKPHWSIEVCRCA